MSRHLRVTALKDAINRAIDECIEEDVLAEFFIRRREEVLEMEALDFTFERRLELGARDSHMDGCEEGREMGRKEGRKEGRAEGREMGRAEGRKDTIFSLVSEKDLSMEKGAEKLHLSLAEFERKMTEAGYQLPV